MLPPVEAFFWLITCVYFESRGEPWDGQKAVAHTVMNRAELRGKSIKDTVLAPYQFSWANDSNRPPIEDYQAYIRCGESVVEALRERSEGKTFHWADHYHATYIEPPSWTRGMDVVATIGQHTFYKSR